MPEENECEVCSDECDEVVEVGNHSLCLSCSENHVECADCSDAVHTNDSFVVQPNDRLVCQSCSDEYTTCCNCDAMWQDRDMHDTVSGSHVCSDCASDYYHACSHCGDYEHRDDCVWDNNGDTVYCDSCYSDHYFTCDNCGYIYSNDDYGGSGCCGECSDNDRGCLDCYSTKPSSECLGKGPYYFGIELEVEADEGELTSQVEHTRDHLGGFAVLKDDGSLEHGFEICTQPASLQVQKDKWAPFFRDRPPHIRSYKTTTCGMHVHVSRKPMSQLQIGKILVFVNSNQNRDFIKFIAQRGSGTYTKVSPKKMRDAMCHDRNNDHAYKYEAVNLLHSASIEFRIFRGTLKKESFFKNIEFCAALVRFCEPAARSIADCQDRWKFYEFVKAHRKDYPNLNAAIQDNWIARDNGGESVPEEPQPRRNPLRRQATGHEYDTSVVSMWDDDHARLRMVELGHCGARHCTSFDCLDIASRVDQERAEAFAGIRVEVDRTRNTLVDAINDMNTYIYVDETPTQYFTIGTDSTSN